MTILSKGDKTISVSFGEGISKKEIVEKNIIYTVALPEITCNKQTDAEFIQQEVNAYVNSLIKNMLDEG